MGATAAAAGAQGRLAVQVVDSASGNQLAGVVVSVWTPPPGGRRLVERLTGGDGRAVFPSVPASAVVLRVRRIGYVPYESPVVRVGAGGGGGDPVVVRLPARRVVLPSVAVMAADPRCTSGFGRAGGALALWTEIQASLASAELADAAAEQLVPVYRTERLLDEDGRELYREPPLPVAARPAFEGASPAELSLHGYVAMEGGGAGATFLAPGVAVLRSDEFEREHCFQVVAEPPAADSLRGLLGLAFEPIRGRRVPDVAGVLWVDTAAAALRHVTFRYTRTPSGMAARHAGGDVRLGPLPSGAWGVRSWELRMPLRTGRPTGEPGPFLSGVREMPAASAHYVALGATIRDPAAEGTPSGPSAATGLDGVVAGTGIRCDEYGASACLRHAFDYQRGAGLPDSPARAAAYYLGACRGGPSARLRDGSRGGRGAAMVDTSEIERRAVALEARLDKRAGGRGGMAEADLAADEREEYERRAQLDGCVRAALAVLGDEGATPAAHADAATLLAAACDEIEPIACTLRGLLGLAGAATVADSAVAAAQLRRGCAGHHSEGCRALFRLRPDIDPDTLRLRGARGKPGPTAADLLDTWAHGRLGADRRGLGVEAGPYAAEAARLRAQLPFAEVEAFAKGILIRIWPNRSMRGRLPPAELVREGALAALVDAVGVTPGRRITVVVHEDEPVPGSWSRLRNRNVRRLGEEYGQAWREELARRGVERRRINIVVRGYSDPLASNESLLGREQNRRVEILVQ